MLFLRVLSGDSSVTETNEITKYEVLKDCRDFGLKDQMTRSAVSIPSNISEGCERDLKAVFSCFLHIAKGSAAELRTHVYIAQRVGLLSSTDKDKLVEEFKEILSMLQCLISSIKKRT